MSSPLMFVPIDSVTQLLESFDGSAEEYEAALETMRAGKIELSHSSERCPQQFRCKTEREKGIGTRRWMDWKIEECEASHYLVWCFTDTEGVIDVEA